MHNVDVIDLSESVPTAPASARSLVQGIQDALREAISNGSLPPGYRLREIPLAAHFNCSTTPVREAIRHLEHEGLVTVLPRRGAEVASISASNIAHLYETRAILECSAVRKVAELRPSAHDLAKLKTMLEHQRDMVESGRVPTLYPTDVEFHQELCRLSGNPVTSDLVARLVRQIQTVRVQADATVAQGPQHTIGAHEGIISAIEKGQADRAESLMRKHLAWAEEGLLKALRAAPADKN
jgi:DNA-binding GntR family transcriptional regulator